MSYVLWYFKHYLEIPLPLHFDIWIIPLILEQHNPLSHHKGEQKNRVSWQRLSEPSVGVKKNKQTNKTKK